MNSWSQSNKFCGSKNSTRLGRTYYMHNNEMFVLKYHQGLEVGEYYLSDSKDYINMNYEPQDPGYKSYEELDIKPVSTDIPLRSAEQK